MAHELRRPYVQNTNDLRLKKRSSQTQIRPIVITKLIITQILPIIITLTDELPRRSSLPLRSRRQRTQTRILSPNTRQQPQLHPSSHFQSQHSPATQKHSFKEGVHRSDQYSMYRLQPAVTGTDIFLLPNRCKDLYHL